MVNCLTLFEVNAGGQGNPKGCLANGGLARGAPIEKTPFGAISALPLWLWSAEELVPIGPEKTLIGPEKAPICPEKADFPRRIPPRFSLKMGLKPPLVSPRLDFPKGGVQAKKGPRKKHLNSSVLNLTCLCDGPKAGPRGSMNFEESDDDDEDDEEGGGARLSPGSSTRQCKCW